MSKVLNKLIDSDNRFDKEMRYDQDEEGYLVYLNVEYHVDEVHTLYGRTVADILSQLKDIEKTYWDVDSLG